MTLADTQVTPEIETTTSTDAKSPDTKILLTVLAVLAAWGVAIFQYGVPGLYIPALAMVPVIYVILILISRG